MVRPPLRATLFPYTTLFRSLRQIGCRVGDRRRHLVADRGFSDGLDVHRVVAAGDREARQVEGVRAGREVTERCQDRKSTRLNSSHMSSSYAVFCLKKKKSVICLTRRRRSMAAGGATTQPTRRPVNATLAKLSM